MYNNINVITYYELVQGQNYENDLMLPSYSTLFLIKESFCDLSFKVLWVAFNKQNTDGKYAKKNLTDSTLRDRLNYFS